MLILPPVPERTAHGRRGLRTRERWMIGGVSAVVVALVVALAISLTAGGGRSGAGCVSVALAYSTGGAQIDRCGAGARALCAGVGHPGGVTGAPAEKVARGCRRAGLAVG